MVAVQYVNLAFAPTYSVLFPFTMVTVTNMMIM